MTFFHAGLAAAGVACVAIPIIIHLLFRRRRKPVAWAAMRFLIEAMKKQRRRLRLETLLLLATRCLLVLCLGMAIARPLLEQAGFLGGAGGGRDVYLLIDNGLGASARSGDGAPGAAEVSALERHKQAAVSIIEAMGSGDRVGLVVLGAPADLTVVPAASDGRAVRAIIQDLKPTDSATDLPGALERLGARLRADDVGSEQRTRERVIVVLSDFTSGSADISRPLPPALAGIPNVTLACSPPPPSPPGNVQLISVEPLRAVVLTGGRTGGAEAQQVRVVLRRTGAAVSQPGVTSLRVGVSDGSKSTEAGGAAAGPGGTGGSATVRWEPGQSDASVTVQVDAGAAVAGSAMGAADGGRSAAGERVLVAEIDRDAVSGDNVRRRPVEVRDRIQVGVIAQRVFGSAGRVDKLSAADWYRLALRPGEEAPIDVVDLEPSAIDSPAMSVLDAVVLPSPDQIAGEGWTRLRRFAEAGGLVVVSPPESATVHLWPDQFVKAFGLPWRIGREARESGRTPVGLAPPVESGGGAGGEGGSILAMIAPEMKQLVKPVGVSKWLSIEDSRGPLRPVLALSDGSAWMVASRIGAAEAPAGASSPSSADDKAGAEKKAATAAASGRGLVVFLASAPTLSWTDLPSRPLVVPLMQELIRQGLGEAGGSLSATAGQAVGVPGGTAELRTMGAQAQGAAAIVVSKNGVAADAMRHAGLWRAVDGAGRTRGIVAVNADADAGRTQAQPQEAVGAWLSGAKGAAAEGGSSEPAVAWMDAKRPTLATELGGAHGSPFTLPLLWAAMGFGLLEVFFARYFSHAFDRGPGPGRREGQGHAVASAADSDAASRPGAAAA